jgi:hypothetical protein
MVDSHPQEEASSVNKPFHYASVIFQECWVLLFFGSLFVLMVTLPLVFSGFLSMAAFAIVVAFLGALMIGVVLPKLIGIYILFLTILMFVLQPGAFAVGYPIALLFLGSSLFGLVTIPFKK